MSIQGLFDNISHLSNGMLYRCKDACLTHFFFQMPCKGMITIIKRDLGDFIQNHILITQQDTSGTISNQKVLEKKARK